MNFLSVLSMQKQKYWIKQCTKYAAIYFQWKFNCKLDKIPGMEIGPNKLPVKYKIVNSIYVGIIIKLWQ